MKQGKCPKCEGTNIYTSKNSDRYYGERSRVDVTGFYVLITDMYICADCRYIEEYIRDKDDFEKLKKKWHRVE